MKTEAKIIADSMNPFTGDRLTTVEVNLHRFVLAELNTHRVFSRNSASSRAIPVSKMMDAYITTPAYPNHWPAEQKGMSGGEKLEGEELYAAQHLFEDINSNTANRIRGYLAQCEERGYNKLHKSLLNRLMEPQLWHRVIITSTEWDNFFKQRCHPAAQPEMRDAAVAIHDAIVDSTPVNVAGWHLPYIQPDEEELLVDGVVTWDVPTGAAVSAARCARVSYLTHDGKRDIDADIDLYVKLSKAMPPHWSPMEHVAYAYDKNNSMPVPNRNFAGWVQLRQMLEDDDG